MSYQSLFNQIVAIVDSYSFGTMLNGLDPSLVNILLTNHIAKIELCTDYSTSIAMINHAISAHVGMSLHIDTFITEDKDRRKLYDLFQEWRQHLIADVNAQRLLPKNEKERCI